MLNDARETIETLPLTAEALCLDFVNTLDGRLEPEQNELLRDYADLLRFGERTGSLGADVDIDEWLWEAHRTPAQADDVLHRARDLREALFRIFLALAHHEEPANEDVATLDGERSIAEACHLLVFKDGRFSRTWLGDIAFARPLWPIALSATELLEHGDLTRIHQCAADDCACLFLDTTRNRSRRWCTRSGCGNRARVREYRERQRGG